MSINSLFYTSVLCKAASVVALAVFFFSYWSGVDVRTLTLCLGASLASLIVGQGFHFYFEQVVAHIAIAKHTAEKNMIKEIIDEAGDKNVVITDHPLFTQKEEDND